MHFFRRLHNPHKYKQIGLRQITITKTTIIKTNTELKVHEQHFWFIAESAEDKTDIDELYESIVYRA